MSEERMSVRGYAKSRGMAHTSVDYQIRKGRIPLIEGKIDPEYADFVFREKVNKMQSRRGRGQQRKEARAADLGGVVPAAGGTGWTGGTGAEVGAVSLGGPSSNPVVGSSTVSDGVPALVIPAVKLPELPDDSPVLAQLRATIPSNYDQAQFLSAVEDLMKRRAANAEAEGNLTATDKVQRAQFEMARQIRDAMLGIVPRLQDDLAAETDAGACGRMLAAEIRLALESAAKQAAALDEDMASLEASTDAAG